MPEAKLLLRRSSWLIAALLYLFLLVACVPQHRQPALPVKLATVPVPELEVRVILPETPDESPVFPATTISKPALPSLLAGLPEQDLRMLAERAERHFPDHGWQIIAEHSRFVRGRVLDVLQETHSPTSLQVIPAVESGYDPYKVSSAGAEGLWQLMPRTADSLGLRCTPRLNEIRHVEKSTRAAVQYLNALQQRFKYWPLALAAYNCGPARLARLLREQGDWRPADGLDRLPAPRASKAYVKNVLSLAYAQHTGIRTFPAATPLQSIRVSHADIPQLGKALDLSAETLLRLNPELEQIRYPDGKPLSLCIPAETMYADLRNYPDANVKPHVVVVKKGDSLWQIARRLHVPLRDVLRANPGAGSKLHPGQRIRIPAVASADRNPLCLR